MYQAASAVLNPFLPPLSASPFCISHISHRKPTNTRPQVQTISPDSRDQHRPLHLSPSSGRSTAARLSAQGGGSGGGGFLDTSPPWKRSLPHPSFPILESLPAAQRTVPPTGPSGSLLHCSTALSEGGVQPAATPSRRLSPPPSCPGAGTGPLSPPAFKSAATKAKAPAPTDCLPLLTFRAQKCGPGSPLVAPGGATDSWLVSEEFRLSDSTAP